MSLEHSPARPGDRDVYTVNEFCDAHRISRATFYELLREGRGPRLMRIDTRIESHGKPPPTGARASEAAT